MTKNEDLYTYSIPVGSTLILNRPISIPANLGRTFFQSGKIVSENSINIYYPHCSLTVNTILDYERTISPTQFTIYKVMDNEEYAQGYILYASSNINVSSDGPIITGLASYYYLRSPTESDVRTLECIQWDSPYENNYLSIREVRKALGDVFSLNLND
jgi:hypothetical protein